MPVTDEQLAYWQALVDGVNQHFLAAVTKGRKGKMTPSKVRDAADGRVYLADEALAMGLIDGVMRLDEAMEGPRKVKPPPRDSRLAAASLRAKIRAQADE